MANKKKAEPTAQAGVRPSLADGMRHAFARVSEQTKRTIRATSIAREFRKNLIYTGQIELDLALRMAMGSRIQLVGDTHMGKTMMAYLLMGAIQRTCRRCYTPIISFTNEQTGEVIPTCMCGKKDGGVAVFVDAETEFDPAWASVMGVQVDGDLRMDGKPDDYEEVVPGLRVSPSAKFAVCRLETAEQAKIIVDTLFSMGAVDVITVDSLAVLTPQERKEGRLQPGALARALALMMNDLISSQSAVWIREGVQPTFIATNQYRTKMNLLNPKQDPREAAGGNAVKFSAMQTYKIRSTTNADIEGGYKVPTATLDMTIKCSKDKIGGTTNAEAHVKFYTRAWSQGKADYMAGETSESAKLFELIKEAGEGNPAEGIPPNKLWFEKTTSGYSILGRKFKLVKEIHQFLKRDDIRYMLRLPLMAMLLPEAARAHLDVFRYGYTPFDDEPILDLLEEAQERIGKITSERRAGNPAAEEVRAAGASPSVGGDDVDEFFGNDEEQESRTEQ